MDITNKKFTPHFGAIHVANCNEIKICKLDLRKHSDYEFVRTLSDKIQVKNLMPDLDKYGYARWQEMIEYAANKALESKNTTYVGLKDNKPCGIITFKIKKISELDCICTWPVEFGEKVKLAGKSLFYQFFKDFTKMKEQRIKLDAITDGPYNTVKKYAALGFKSVESLPTKEKMETTAPKVKEVMKELSNLLAYEEVKPHKIDLRETI